MSCGKGRHAQFNTRLEGRGHTNEIILQTTHSLRSDLRLEEMEAYLAFAVWFLCLCSLGNVKPVHSSHFMGGLIRWRPVNPATFDGRVRNQLEIRAITMSICSMRYEGPS